MKNLLPRAALLGAFALTCGSAIAADVVKGTVLEVRDVEIYSYLKLRTAQGETWAAVGKAPIKVGAEVTIQNASVMRNFESKSLKQTFPSIVFGELAGKADTATTAAMAHGAVPVPAMPAEAPVPKASGANAFTVAEVAAKGSQIKDKTARVAGRVAKVNAGIMGRNWVHLRDGSGTAAEGNNDLIVITREMAKVGEVVTAQGTVRTDKDFGAGYRYAVVIEDATLQR